MNENKILNFTPRLEKKDNQPENGPKTKNTNKSDKEVVSLDRARAGSYQGKFNNLKEKLRTIEIGQSYGDKEPGRPKKIILDFYRETGGFIYELDCLMDKLEEDAEKVDSKFEEARKKLGDQEADNLHGDELADRAFELQRLLDVRDRTVNMQSKVKKMLLDKYKTDAE